MNKTRILVVEDDPNLGQILQEYLSVKGYEPTLCKDGQEGFETYKVGAYDLCIFDVMMPRMDGFTLAEKIRAIDLQVPIIFLTAKAMKEDAIHGFKVGGDDYVNKPFSMEELLLRINAILRRAKSAIEEKEANTTFEIGKFSFHYDTQLLHNSDTPDDKPRKLTSKEAELLRLLCINKNGILDRTIALKKIWLNDNYFNSRSMDVYITKLRKYLRADEQLQIMNVHGQGFKLLEITNDKTMS